MSLPRQCAGELSGALARPAQRRLGIVTGRRFNQPLQFSEQLRSRLDQRIASGGELSRSMLALKALTAGVGEVPTIIFDEVDAGIGGAVAEAVGKRLHDLGRSRQALCITHLPQIAALAEHHFAVEKRVIDGRTTAIARALHGSERVEEIARMLGGPSSPESQRYARRLIASAESA